MKKKFLLVILFIIELICLLASLLIGLFAIYITFSINSGNITTNIICRITSIFMTYTTLYVAYLTLPKTIKDINKIFKAN